MKTQKFNRKTRNLKAYAQRNERILRALGKKGATQTSVATLFGLTRGRISQLVKEIR